MNLKELHNKTILLFGKSRSFESDEFDAQMQFHKINVVKEYVDDVTLIVEGRMMTPYEQNKSEVLYEQRKAPFCSIDELESALAKDIDVDTLLMSLKLSHDKARLKGFLQNSMMSDTLFFKLLKMYVWSGEDFFENDYNRDVTAALIARFYENIERNHNVQYATLGLMHLVVQCKDPLLIETIASLEPLQKSFQGDSRDPNYSIVTAMAKHPLTPLSVQKMLMKKSNVYVKTLVAMRPDCVAEIQNRLFESGEELLIQALAHNPNLSKEIAQTIIKAKKYNNHIARYIKIDDALFELLLQDSSWDLAQNESLTPEMQNRLVQLHKTEINLALASNCKLHQEIIVKLLSEPNEEIRFALYANVISSKEQLSAGYKDEKNHAPLAGNKNTPVDILRLLSESEDAKVLEALAKNTNTPVDILYQLQLDSRFERFVKENASFGKHIQTENIGWLV